MPKILETDCQHPLKGLSEFTRLSKSFTIHDGWFNRFDSRDNLSQISEGRVWTGHHLQEPQ